MRGGFITATIVLMCVADPVRAQSPGRIELAAQVSAVRLSGIDATDSGIGARVAWHIRNALALEAVSDYFPTGAHDVARGGRKLHALFGPKIGWRSDRVGVFAKMRAGIARVSEGRQAGTCILIFPAPESCYVADTRLAFDVGGAFEIYPSARTSLRVDAGTFVTRLGDSSSRFGRNGNYARDADVTASVGFRF